MDSGAGNGPDPDITPDLLADLQAGLLDDETAARVRRRARTDPHAARMLADLDSVRRELTRLGTDAASAPEVPAAVRARISAALQDAPRPAGHTLRPRLTTAQRAGLALGLGAAGAAAVVGALTLTRHPAAPTAANGPTASQITVSRAPEFPVPDADLRAALAEPAELGPLADPQRRGSCLAGLGHPPTAEVLGGRQLSVWGRSAVLLLLPGEASGQVTALVIEPACSAAHTGLLAEKTLDRQ